MMNCDKAKDLLNEIEECGDCKIENEPFELIFPDGILTI